MHRITRQIDDYEALRITNQYYAYEIIREIYFCLSTTIWMREKNLGKENQLTNEGICAREKTSCFLTRLTYNLG